MSQNKQRIQPILHRVQLPSTFHHHCGHHNKDGYENFFYIECLIRLPMSLYGIQLLVGHMMKTREAKSLSKDQAHIEVLKKHSITLRKQSFWIMSQIVYWLMHQTLRYVTSWSCRKLAQNLIFLLLIVE